MDNNKRLNINYALIQFAYFIPICGMIGFANNYFQAIGIKNMAIIGVILAIGNVLTALAAPALATYVDKVHLSINRVLTFLSIVSTAIAVALLVFSGIPVIDCVIFVVLFVLIQCMMPLMNALCFVFEKHGININYGTARGIGSTAYAFSALGLGLLAPRLIPIPIIVGLAIMIPLTMAFRIRGVKSIAEDEVEEVAEATSTTNFFAEHKMFIVFLGGFILVYADHMIINTYLLNVVTNILNDAVAASRAMGTAAFVAAILELVAMFALDKVRNRVSITLLLRISAIMFTVKHVITALATNMLMIYFAQFLQMFAYAIFIPASVYYVNELFAKEDAVKGQSFVTTSMTVAGIISTLLGGFLISLLGIHNTLMFGAGVSLVGTVIMLITCQKPKKSY
ncbi:MAG: MFS transporter [Erysipelotrichaceae bacterium]|nr:MFS transporter [Erysipelotrichaceae bacterium]